MFIEFIEVHVDENMELSFSGNKVAASSEDEKYICELCKKCYKTEKSLVAHIKYVEFGLGLSCEYCQECFSKMNHLLYHLLTCNKKEF